MGRSDKESRSKSNDRKKRSKKNHKREKRKKSYSSSSSSSSRSRSRSRSLSHSRKDKTKKYTSKRSRSKYRSLSLSGSSSRSRSKSRNSRSPKHKNKESSGRNRFNDIPKNVRPPKDRIDDKGRKRFSVNNFALAGLILDTKKTNERLDKEEVERANVKFKKFDKSERKAVLMSQAINSQKDIINQDEYYMEFRNGEYIRVQKPYLCGFGDCKMRFAYSYELEEHLKQHKSKEDNLNQKKAKSFMEQFDI